MTSGQSSQPQGTSTARTSAYCTWHIATGILHLAYCTWHVVVVVVVVNRSVVTGQAPVTLGWKSIYLRKKSKQTKKVKRIVPEYHTQLMHVVHPPKKNINVKSEASVRMNQVNQGQTARIHGCCSCCPATMLSSKNEPLMNVRACSLYHIIRVADYGEIHSSSLCHGICKNNTWASSR